jgi:trans-2,3-dihydro-3-hydroxyanthranilate isomerase
MSPRLDYHVVDVFTDVSYAGNPLAVVLGADDLTTAQLQLIAREFHLSETAFPLEPTPAERGRGVDYRLRIFTPGVELPFAGHPSVGTAWLLARLGRVQPGTVIQACGAGELPLLVAPDGGLVELMGGEPSCSEAVDPAPFLAAVGLGPGDLDAADVRPPRICGTGLGYAILPVRPEALARCSPNPALLSAFSHPVSAATGVYVVAWDAATSSARARMFAGDIGVTEDPATGSAALAYGVWLVASGLLVDSAAYEVVQGVEMGRRSTLSCSVDVEGSRASRVTVRGQVAHVAEGKITPPSP